MQAIDVFLIVFCTAMIIYIIWYYYSIYFKYFIFDAIKKRYKEYEIIIRYKIYNSSYHKAIVKKCLECNIEKKKITIKRVSPFKRVMVLYVKASKKNLDKLISLLNDEELFFEVVKVNKVSKRESKF